eukprot:jgi/Mesen1/7521/ME000039S06742
MGFIASWHLRCAAVADFSFTASPAASRMQSAAGGDAILLFSLTWLFSRLTHGFDMVVIDEAAQASEVAVLAPLSLRAARCVLVGDPQQLPATVISRMAQNMLYRWQWDTGAVKAGAPGQGLVGTGDDREQVAGGDRWQVMVRSWWQRKQVVARIGGGDKLFPGQEAPDPDPNAKAGTNPNSNLMAGAGAPPEPPNASTNVPPPPPAMQEVAGAGAEAAAGGAAPPPPPPQLSVGIVTPYKQQLRLLKREFEPVLAVTPGASVYINTVDAFQGQERDVIMMSCVRASLAQRGVGFVSDIRRMNVALTRAKRALWVFGNATSLAQSDAWAALIEDAKRRGCFVPHASAALLFSPGDRSGADRGGPAAEPRFFNRDFGGGRGGRSRGGNREGRGGRWKGRRAEREEGGGPHRGKGGDGRGGWRGRGDFDDKGAQRDGRGGERAGGGGGGGDNRGGGGGPDGRAGVDSPATAVGWERSRGAGEEGGAAPAGGAGGGGGAARGVGAWGASGAERKTGAEFGRGRLDDRRGRGGAGGRQGVGAEGDAAGAYLRSKKKRKHHVDRDAMPDGEGTATATAAWGALGLLAGSPSPSPGGSTPMLVDTTHGVGSGGVGVGAGSTGGPVRVLGGQGWGAFDSRHPQVRQGDGGAIGGLHPGEPGLGSGPGSLGLGGGHSWRAPGRGGGAWAVASPGGAAVSSSSRGGLGSEEATAGGASTQPAGAVPAGVASGALGRPDGGAAAAQPRPWIAEEPLWQGAINPTPSPNPNWSAWAPRAAANPRDPRQALRGGVPTALPLPHSQQAGETSHLAHDASHVGTAYAPGGTGVAGSGAGEVPPPPGGVAHTLRGAPVPMAWSGASSPHGDTSYHPALAAPSGPRGEILTPSQTGSPGGIAPMRTDSSEEEGEWAPAGDASDPHPPTATGGSASGSEKQGGALFHMDSLPEWDPHSKE